MIWPLHPLLNVYDRQEFHIPWLKSSSENANFMIHWNWSDIKGILKKLKSWGQKEMAKQYIWICLDLKEWRRGGGTLVQKLKQHQMAGRCKRIWGNFKPSLERKGTERHNELPTHLARKGLERQLLRALFTGRKSVVSGLGALENAISIRNFRVTLGSPADDVVQSLTQPLHDHKWPNFSDLLHLVNKMRLSLCISQFGRVRTNIHLIIDTLYALPATH